MFHPMKWDPNDFFKRGTLNYFSSRISISSCVAQVVCGSIVPVQVGAKIEKHLQNIVDNAKENADTKHCNKSTSQFFLNERCCESIR